MLTAASQTVILIFGFLIFFVSSWGVAQPRGVVSNVHGLVQKRWGIETAIGMRLLLGLSLLVAASASRYPVFFQLLGWVTIAAAVVLVFVNRERVRRMVGRLAEGSEKIALGVFVLGLVLGQVLVLGVI